MFSFMRVSVFLLLAVGLFASDMLEYSDNKADCIVLKDENSIICKYTHKRINSDKTVKFQWIEPDGAISRQRDMVIPAGHGSVYDYRFIKGRTKGKWTFKVIDASNEYTTNFTLE